MSGKLLRWDGSDVLDSRRVVAAPLAAHVKRLGAILDHGGAAFLEGEIKDVKKVHAGKEVGLLWKALRASVVREDLVATPEGRQGCHLGVVGWDQPNLLSIIHAVYRGRLVILCAIAHKRHVPVAQTVTLAVRAIVGAPAKKGGQGCPALASWVTQEAQQLYHMNAQWVPSSRLNPCPICGREKDGDCRTRADGEMVFCHRGKSSGPPERLKPGQIVTDASGKRWAYSGDSRDDSRDGAVFVAHQDQAAHGLPACEPYPGVSSSPAVRKDRDCTATVYQYTQELRVVRYDFADEKEKDFSAQFLSGGQWCAGAGGAIWPFYGCLDGSNGDSIIEVEGEKCVNILRLQGIAAITHPGHQRDRDSCKARYSVIAQAGIKTVYYISDNDKAGRTKAASFAEAAEQAGVDFRIIAAESIHGVPDGGSVDDMPIEQLPQLIAVAIKSGSGVKVAPLSRVSYGKIKAALLEFCDSSPSSFADVQAGVADIASSFDASVFDVKRIWDSIQEDRETEGDALGASKSILMRQELEERRKQIRLVDYLPESTCRAVEELTGNLACDPLTAVATVLTTAAGVMRAGHRVDAGDGLFVKEPIVWMLLAGPSGSGKSPVMRILSQYRLGLVFGHYHQLSVEAETQYEERYGHLPKNQRPDRPEELVTCVTDFTTEKLVGVIADNHEKGLPTFIYSEEVREIIGNFDEYKSAGKGRGRETFLCLFDGTVNSQHRVGRRTKRIVGKVQNALLGGVQPGVFRRMVEGGDDAGLFARCLIVPLISGYVEPNFYRTPEELQVVHLAERCLEDFYVRCLSLKPLVLRLEREAVELFSLLSRDTHDKAGQVSLESQRAVLGKRLGYILQIALTMHLCRVAAGEEKEDELFLSKRTLARATVFVDLLQGYAIAEQQESQMQRHGAFDLNRRVHSFAMHSNGTTVSAFYNSCIPVKYRQTIKSPAVKAAMDQLVAMDLGLWQEHKGKLRFVALGKYPD